MGMFRQVRDGLKEGEDKTFLEIWLEALALWLFAGMCLLVVTIGGIVEGAAWLFSLPSRWKSKL